VYTAVALVEQRTIWLDDYLPYIQERAGEVPYMVTFRPSGHVVTSTPTASSFLALPPVAVFSAVGVDAGDFDAWMEAGMFTAALAAAASVALLFIALTRLTSHNIAAVSSATYAWGTLTWGVSGQALWQHPGAVLALSALLLALVTRRLALAGVASGAMVAFRLPTAIIALLLLPLVGRRPFAWGRFALGLLPYGLALAAYNHVAFGSPLRQGYGTEPFRWWLALDLENLADGLPGLLVSPGRGLFVYSPVLLFAVFGALRGWRTPLYRWCAVAAAAYILSAANSPTWHGGESFGARRIVDVLPLLAILLVPALEALRATKWLWLYGTLFAWSVSVQLLGTAAWERAAWFDGRTLTEDSWWSVRDNEIVAMIQSPDVVPRLLVMIGVLVGGIGFGVLATAATENLRRTRARGGKRSIDPDAEEVRS
jgi:hypothetical protein